MTYTSKSGKCHTHAFEPRPIVTWTPIRVRQLKGSKNFVAVSIRANAVYQNFRNHSWIAKRNVWNNNTLTPPLPKSGATNLFEAESYFLVQIRAKGYQFDTHTSETVVEAGAQAWTVEAWVHANPQKFRFGENSDKICENLSKIPENLCKVPKTMGKKCAERALIWKNWRPTCFWFEKKLAHNVLRFGKMASKITWRPLFFWRSSEKRSSWENICTKSGPKFCRANLGKFGQNPLPPKKFAYSYTYVLK